MQSAQQYVSAKEITASIGLNVRSVKRRAQRQKWESKMVCRDGHRMKVYRVGKLPEEVQERLSRPGPETLPAASSPPPAHVEMPAVVPTTGEPMAPAEMPDWARSVAVARKAILDEVNRWTPPLTVDRAITRVVELAREEVLPGPLQTLASEANARKGKGGKRTLSKSRIYEWRKSFREGGVAALAPKIPERTPPPAWGTGFLRCFRNPSKPTINEAIEALARLNPSGHVPTERQARYFIDRMSRLDIQRGRMSPNQRRSVRLYTERDTSNFEPLDICLTDGHSFKARVAHPVHGKPFKPEVCAVLDAVTRVCTGWSAGLAESSQTVADALRHAVTVNDQKRYGGIPAILYTDNGAGNTADVNANPLIGLYARLGIDFNTGRPGNAQGRGLVERMQGSLWVRAAKQLPTFTGKGMDPTAERRVYLDVEKDIKTQGRSDLLIPWRDFLDFCQDQVDAYNRRPHTALPKITDRETGRRRHMAPGELWAQFMANGWRPVVPIQEELEDLFRPRKQVKTRRGIVRLFGSTYANPVLEHYHGETVIVEYDIHDPSFVRVRDLQERRICRAGFESNKRKFYPDSQVEEAREQRANRRLKNNERRREEIVLERQGPQPKAVHLTPEQDALAQRVLAEADKRDRREREAAEKRMVPLEECLPESSDERPRWKNELDRYEWLREARNREVDLTEEEESFLLELDAQLFGVPAPESQHVGQQ